MQNNVPTLEWLSGVRHCPSPNFNARPVGGNVDLLVIHNISLPPGRFGTGHIERFFCNTLPVEDHEFYRTIAEMKVSSHFLIDRLGQITQFVGLQERAWHAGESSFQGRSNCNDFSIGIELEGTDEQPYTDEQYKQLVCLTDQLMELFPLITMQRIVGHSDIAPLRKTDPGGSFDWVRYRLLLQESRLKAGKK